MSEAKATRRELEEKAKALWGIFTPEENAALEAAGFGWLSPNDGYARFRHEDIEHLHLSSKVFIRKGVSGPKIILVVWYVTLYGGKERGRITHKSFRKRVSNVSAALDWLGAFAGQRTFPAPSGDLGPSGGQGCPEEPRLGAQPAAVQRQGHGQESIHRD